MIVDDSLAPTPTVNVGDTLSGATVGVLSYGFGNYMLEVTATPTVSSGGITSEFANQVSDHDPQVVRVPL